MGAPKHAIAVRRCLSAPLSIVLLSLPTALFAQTAQTASPSQVTPPILPQAKAPPERVLDITAEHDAVAPQGAGTALFTPELVAVEGGFPEFAAETDRLTAPLAHARVSVAQLYDVAGKIERLYANRGFVLVRVVVPPQSLGDGATARIAVLDGFIESVDVAGVPSAIRRAVARRLAPIALRHHVRLGDLERALLLAGELAGTQLRSTLVRGAQEGGAKLVIDGSRQALSAQLGVDNDLSPALGDWRINASLSLNSTLGLGEQLYASASRGARHPGAGTPIQIYGGGAIVPLGVRGLTINPEYTYSKVIPVPASNLVPPTAGVLRRATLRIAYPLVRRQGRSLDLSAMFERIDERNTAIGFAPDISHDVFSAVRAGANGAQRFGHGLGLNYGGVYSQGLAIGGARTRSDASTVGAAPLSRQGAGPVFSKLEAHLAVFQSLGAATTVSFAARGQAALSGPLLQAERFSLDGADTLSGFVSGSLVADSGVSARIEVSHALVVGAAVPARGLVLSVEPYVYGAAGTGRNLRPTPAERDSFTAASIGAGVHFNLDRARAETRGSVRGPGFVLSAEASKPWTNAPFADRSVRATIRFTAHI